MAGRILEKSIENEILNMLKGCGFFVFKVDRQGTFDPVRRTFRSNKNPHKIKGVSDILGLCNGRFIAIEVKSQTGSLTDDQRIFIAKINAEGGLAFVARSAIQAANELLKHFPDNLKIQAFIGRNSGLN